MKLDELWAEIEAEQEWRQAEMRFFQNQLVHIPSEAEQDKFRRALILLLYAHFEGFSKFVFTLYINAINSEGVSCEQANYAIAAASLNDVFKALRDPQSKCSEFKDKLPDDSELHRFARDREFMQRSKELEKRKISISDAVVDTESNLKPIILRKILYRLGFRHDQFESIEGKIHCLLNRRNGIGHGESKDGIPLGKYNELRDAAYEIMDGIKSGVMNALQERHYLR